MNSFFSNEELDLVGFQSIGTGVLISRKASIYGPSKISIGNNVRVDDFCILSGNITIGNHIHVAAFCGLYGGEAGIQIADFCNLSSRISIYAISDDFSGETLTNPMIPDQFKKIKHGKVILNKHVIIGSGSVVLPEVQLGEGCSIGALSLVRDSLPPWTICAGIPAKVIRPRCRALLGLEAEFVRQFENQDKS